MGRVQFPVNASVRSADRRLDRRLLTWSPDSSPDPRTRSIEDALFEDAAGSRCPTSGPLACSSRSGTRRAADFALTGVQSRPERRIVPEDTEVHAPVMYPQSRAGAISSCTRMTCSAWPRSWSASAIYYAELRRRGWLYSTSPGSRSPRCSAARSAPGSSPPGSAPRSTRHHVAAADRRDRAERQSIIGRSPEATWRSSWRSGRSAIGARRDAYLLALPIATASGDRCFLSELPLGTPTPSRGACRSARRPRPRSPVPGCGGPMHPTMLYEIASMPRQPCSSGGFARVPDTGRRAESSTSSARRASLLVEYIGRAPGRDSTSPRPQWLLISDDRAAFLHSPARRIAAPGECLSPPPVADPALMSVFVASKGDPDERTQCCRPRS